MHIASLYLHLLCSKFADGCMADSRKHFFLCLFWFKSSVSRLIISDRQEQKIWQTYLSTNCKHVTCIRRMLFHNFQQFCYFIQLFLHWIALSLAHCSVLKSQYYTPLSMDLISVIKLSYKLGRFYQLTTLTCRTHQIFNNSSLYNILSFRPPLYVTIIKKL